MADTQQAFAMLKILCATCQAALDAMQAADNPVDRELVADLERMTERTRIELERLASSIANPS